MPSPRPVKPSCSVVVALTLTRSADRREQPGDPGGHRRAVRADPRLLADQRDVDVLDAPARGRHEVTGVSQENRRIGARPARLARREMAADVAGANGAEQRVGQRVQPDVGIRMAEQAQRAGDAHAEQDDTFAGRQPVHVEAEPGAPPPRRPQATARRARDPPAR